MDPLKILQDARDRVYASQRYVELGHNILTHAIGHLIGCRYSSVDIVLHTELGYRELN